MNADVIAQLKYILQVTRAKREVSYDDFITLTMALHDQATREGILNEVRQAEEAIEASIRSQRRCADYGVSGGPKSKYNGGF
jgi:hypothetical protein